MFIENLHVKKEKSKKKNPDTLRGRVETLFYSSARFSAGRIRTNDGDSVSFAGAIMVQEGDLVALHGEWTNHSTYGRQFQVSSFEFDLPLDPEGLALYLSHHPRIKGIGPVKAKKIAERFGVGFEAALFDRPEDIALHAGLHIDVVTNLQKEWQHTKTLNAAITWLASFGLTFKQITTLVDRYGNAVVTALKENPYRLIREIRGYGFRKIDVIARKLGVDKNNPHRIRAGIHECVNERLDDGDSLVDMDDLIEQVNRLLVMDCMDSRELIEQELDSLIEQDELTCISHGGRFLIARPDIYKMETELQQRFKTSIGVNPHFASVKKPEALVDKEAPTLNEEQRQAVLTALSSRIVVITGGAGSGKTYTIGAITNIYSSQDKRVILTAPTGKAAMRMQETIGVPAYTIHRLLKYNGHSFEIEEPLQADLIVVDECSMIDIPLAHQLFQFIDFERTAVVLVGDHNQLPPIGPGNILRDLIDTRLVPCVILNQIVRQAGILKTNSTAILQGEVHKTAPESANGRRPWYLIDQFTDALDIQRFIVDLYENILSERLGFDLLRDVQLLTPTKKGPLGTVELNILLQRVIQKKLFGVNVSSPRPGRRPKFYPHDRVIQIRNNYVISVFNGTLGNIEEVTCDGGLRINFDCNIVEIESDSQEKNDVSLAYALTIHKVQGSEFPCTISIIHKAHTFMHSRNLFYTAVTRSQQSAVVIGDRWGLRNCAQKKLVDRRRTFLSLVERNSKPSVVLQQ